MKTYRIRSVGEPMGPWQEVESWTVYAAVAEVADCAINDVPCSIWRNRDTGAECFMPRDNTGRQWEVSLPGNS